jgi:hypothetical protein
MVNNEFDKGTHKIHDIAVKLVEDPGAFEDILLSGVAVTDEYYARLTINVVMMAIDGLLREIEEDNDLETSIPEEKRPRYVQAGRGREAENENVVETVQQIPSQEFINKIGNNELFSKKDMGVYLQILVIFGDSFKLLIPKILTLSPVSAPFAPFIEIFMFLAQFAKYLIPQAQFAGKKAMLQRILDKLKAEKRKRKFAPFTFIVDISKTDKIQVKCTTFDQIGKVINAIENVLKPDKYLQMAKWLPHIANVANIAFFIRNIFESKTLERIKADFDKEVRQWCKDNKVLIDKLQEKEFTDILTIAFKGVKERLELSGETQEVLLQQFKAFIKTKVQIEDPDTINLWDICRFLPPLLLGHLKDKSIGYLKSFQESMNGEPEKSISELSTTFEYVKSATYTAAATIEFATSTTITVIETAIVAIISARDRELKDCRATRQGILCAGSLLRAVRGSFENLGKISENFKYFIGLSDNRPNKHFGRYPGSMTMPEAGLEDNISVMIWISGFVRSVTTPFIKPWSAQMFNAVVDQAAVTLGADFINKINDSRSTSQGTLPQDDNSTLVWSAIMNFVEIVTRFAIDKSNLL